ncbi:hypothetical protein V8D89_005863 [Ganoderma adspersum]
MPLEFKGYTAHICCDGKELEQYQAQQEDGLTMACWIPSESGKAFTVNWGDNSSNTLMQVKILVDGRCVGRYAHELGPGGCMSGLIDRPDQTRSLLFSQLELTDDDALASRSSTASGLEKLGSIEVQMRKVQAYVKATTPSFVGEVSEIGPVHERSKKAGVHAVSIGAAVPRQPELGRTPIELQSEPFVVFKFLYRPIELLRANGIAPLPPRTGKKRPSDVRDADLDPDGAGPSEPKRARGDVEEEHKVKAERSDGEDEDEDHAVFLQEQIMLLQNRLAQVQAKKPKTIVKREPSPIRVPVDWTNEVIDLT